MQAQQAHEPFRLVGARTARRAPARLAVDLCAEGQIVIEVLYVRDDVVDAITVD